jgi:hypothetical protein
MEIPAQSQYGSKALRLFSLDTLTRPRRLARHKWQSSCSDVPDVRSHCTSAVYLSSAGAADCKFP